MVKTLLKLSIMSQALQWMYIELYLNVVRKKVKQK